MADTRFCERCQKDVQRVGIHSCVPVKKPAEIAPKPKTAKKPALPVERDRPSARPEKLTSTVEAKKTAKIAKVPKVPKVAKVSKAAKVAADIPNIPNGIPNIPNKTEKPTKVTPAQRTKAWRAANPGKHAEYMKGHMRKVRSKPTEAQGRP